LLELVKEHHGVAGFASAGLIMTMPDRASLPVENDISGCENEDAYLANFGDSLKKLRQLLMALPEDIRFEMLVLFFERISTASRIKRFVTTDRMESMSGNHYSLLFCASLDFSRLHAGENAYRYYDCFFGLFLPAKARDDGDHISTAPSEASNEDSVDGKSIIGEQEASADNEG
jgi:hypothetical protein